MSDLPIIFSAPMVRALLAGRKTQTRRILKPQPPGWCGDDRAGFSCLTPTRHVEFRGHYPGDDQVEAGYGSKFIRVPFWNGDRLYVRESFRVNYDANWYREDLGRAPKPKEMDPTSTGVEFLADGEHELGGQRYPSIHMPRWASRLTLFVSRVKVERVQDISDDDAWDEGVCTAVEANDIAQGKPAWDDIATHYRRLIVEQTFGGPAKAFNWLWDGLHRKPGNRWEDNPFVVATTFRVVRGNIDHLQSDRAAA